MDKKNTGREMDRKKKTTARLTDKAEKSPTDIQKTSLYTRKHQSRTLGRGIDGSQIIRIPQFEKKRATDHRPTEGPTDGQTLIQSHVYVTKKEESERGKRKAERKKDRQTDRQTKRKREKEKERQRNEDILNKFV